MRLLGATPEQSLQIPFMGLCCTWALHVLGAFFVIYSSCAEIFVHSKCHARPMGYYARHARSLTRNPNCVFSPQGLQAQTRPDQSHTSNARPRCEARRWSSDSLPSRICRWTSNNRESPTRASSVCSVMPCAELAPCCERASVHAPRQASGRACRFFGQAPQIYQRGRHRPVALTASHLRQIQRK